MNEEDRRREIVAHKTGHREGCQCDRCREVVVTTRDQMEAIERTWKRTADIFDSIWPF